MNQREIAQALGVSQVAVSLVLRNPLTTRVSAEKKAKITAALRKNGFCNGSGMKRVWAAGFITDPLQSRRDSFIHEAVCGAEEEFSSSFYNVIFECFRARELTVFKNRQVDGLIVRSGQALEFLLRSRCSLPLVLLNCAHPGAPLDTVMPDNRGGILSLCRHLTERGFKRIGFIGAAPAYSPYSCNYAERFNAYLEFCRDAGVSPLWHSCALPVGDTPEHRKEFSGLLAAWKKEAGPPDAVIAVNYPYAALLRELAPELAAAAGDNKKLPGQEARVPFVLEQDPRAMGAFAAELLLRRIADPKRRHVRLDCEVALKCFQE